MAHHSQEALGKFSYEVVPQLSSEDSFQHVLSVLLSCCAQQSLELKAPVFLSTLATICKGQD